MVVSISLNHLVLRVKDSFKKVPRVPKVLRVSKVYDFKHSKFKVIKLTIEYFWYSVFYNMKYLTLSRAC